MLTALVEPRSVLTALLCVRKSIGLYAMDHKNSKRKDLCGVSGSDGSMNRALYLFDRLNSESIRLYSLERNEAIGFN